MKTEEAIRIIQTEAECVRRANNCDRHCENCDLLMTDTEILTAYEMAETALREVNQK